MSELEQKFLSILQAALQHQASDVHLMTGQPPAIRTHEGLRPVSAPPFTAEEMLAITQFMISDPELKKRAPALKDLDGSFEIKNLGRFRFNAYRTAGGVALVLRVIAAHVPSIEQLGLPEVLKKIASAPRGLVLVTGATGSGKSSTLAAMINHLNCHHSLHVLTIEDPIEFVHAQKKCRVSQRELGRDTDTFAVALKSALRQDPDVILVGEMRDHETLDIALKAAETGHLVFSTVHTSDAMKTIGRLISLFPVAEQASARARLADNLYAIVSQRLVPGKHVPKVVAQEILITNAAIHECISNEKKTGEIPGFVEKGRETVGMQTFDQHLATLVQKDQITTEAALEMATNPSDFQRNLSFGDTGIEDNNSSLQTLQVDSAPEPAAAPPTGAAPATAPAPRGPLPAAAPQPSAIPQAAKPGAAPAPGPKPMPPKIPKIPGAA